MSDVDASGGLSPAGRFERMERSLARIEEKLDAKADHRDVVDLEARLVIMENKNLAAEAVASAKEDAAIQRGRTILWAVSIVTIGGIFFNAVMAGFQLWLGQQ